MQIVDVDVAERPRGPEASPTLARVCCVCGNVRGRDSTWERRPETAIPSAKVSHGLCPTCYAREYDPG